MDKWNEYIGSVWFNMLNKIPLNNEGIVIEIAPGNVSKIGRGLSQYGFKGTLYIVEPNYFSLGEIIGQYKDLLPDVNIMPINKTLRESIHLLPRNPDAILANHPLDDMIIGDILSTKEFDKFFTNHYDKCSIEETKLLWDIFKSNPKLLEISSEDILEDWILLINKISPKNIVISQYFSFFFKKHKLIEPDKYAIILLRMIEVYSRSIRFNVSYPIDSLVSDKRLWSLIRRDK